MNFEHLEAYPNVESVAHQREVVQSTTTLESYGTFHDKRFHVNSLTDWKDLVRNYAHQNPDMATGDLFQLLTFVGTLCGQYGWNQLNGHFDRHEKNGWNKSFLDPRHVLALASYVGHINEQSIEIKSSFAEQFDDEPEIQAGIMGLLLRSHKGEVRRDPSILADRDELSRYAKLRFESKRNILLPDLDVNKTLAKLRFTGELADVMSDNEFQDEILPRVELILAEHVPGLSVDIFMRQVDRSEPFYSIPVSV